MTKNQTVNIQFGSFSTLLTILFIGLKLTHNIDWSWWWVTAPIWFSFAIVLGVFAVIGFLILATFVLIILREAIKGN